MIGVYAPTSRSGKGAVADYLIRTCGYTRVQFSQPIKDMFKALATYAGMGPWHIAEALEGGLKEEPLAALGGVSFRQFGETVGNDWGRDMVHDTFWIDLWRRRAQSVILRDGRIVVDDLRYPNEADLVRRMGGWVWHVERPQENGGREARWQSEGRIADFAFDAYLENRGTIEDLHVQIRRQFVTQSLREALRRPRRGFDERR